MSISIQCSTVRLAPTDGLQDFLFGFLIPKIRGITLEEQSWVSASVGEFPTTGKVLKGCPSVRGKRISSHWFTSYSSAWAKRLSQPRKASASTVA
jgi:hypothetical protein